MKQENKWVKPIFYLLIAIVGVMGLSLYLRFNPGALGQLEEIPYSQQVPADIQKSLGITVPQEAAYVEGYNMTGVNPVTIWIFQLEPVAGETAEATLRRSFGLGELCTEGVTPINPEHHDTVADTLAALDYGFTHKLFFQNKGASEIQFRVLEDGGIQAALVLKVT